MFAWSMSDGLNGGTYIHTYQVRWWDGGDGAIEVGYYYCLNLICSWLFPDRCGCGGELHGRFN